MSNKIIYAGAEWIKAGLKCEMSPLGITVADLLGEWGYGIYNLNRPQLRKVNWADPRWIIYKHRGYVSTFDFGELTRLVFLCHDMCVRLELTGLTSGWLKMSFSPREHRVGNNFESHPTIEMALYNHRKFYPDSNFF